MEESVLYCCRPFYLAIRVILPSLQCDVAASHGIPAERVSALLLSQWPPWAIRGANAGKKIFHIYYWEGKKIIRQPITLGSHIFFFHNNIYLSRYRRVDSIHLQNWPGLFCGEDVLKQPEIFNVLPLNVKQSCFKICQSRCPKSEMAF